MQVAEFQDWLDLVEDSVLKGDYATYRDHVVLPMSIVTQVSRMTIAAEEELRRGFDAWRGMLSGQGITATIRTPVALDTVSDGEVRGVYVTEYLAGATRVIEPTRSAMHLTLSPDGRWRCGLIESGLDNDRWPLDRLRTGKRRQPGDQN